MTSDRLFKFSSCGVMFLGTCVFFFVLFGGQLNLNNDKNYTLTEGFNIFLSLFFGTPIIGIIISTITVKIIFLFFGYRYYCYVPSNKKIIRHIKNKYPKLKSLSQDSAKWSRKDVKTFYPFYQVELRNIIKDDKLGFLDRRWSAANTQFNNIAAILLAFFFALIIRNDFLTICIKPYQIFTIVIILFYILFAVWNAFQSRWEGAWFEHVNLVNYYKKKTKK